MRSFLYRIVLLCLTVVIQIVLIAIDASPLVVALFLALTTLAAGLWMAYLHSRFLMAVVPVIVSALMAFFAIRVFDPILFLPANESGWLSLSLFVSIPFYIYLSYLLEVEEKRREFRSNVIGFLRGAAEEIRRSTRERREAERSQDATALGSLDELKQADAKEPEVISPPSDREDQSAPTRDKRKIILD